MLRGFQHLAYQETLTDYLRVAMGHLVLDWLDSRKEWHDEDDFIKQEEVQYLNISRPAFYGSGSR